MGEIDTDSQIEDVLRRARTVAVLGAHTERSRAAYYVPDYLREQGYRVLPVNPQLTGQALWGEPVRGRLADITEQVDIVDVFRRAELLAGHLDDLLAMQPRPALVWLQLGIRSDAYARAVQAAGIDVVQDRCTLADHRRLRIGRVAPR